MLAPNPEKKIENFKRLGRENRKRKKKLIFCKKKFFFSKMYALKFYLSPQIIQNITVPFGTLFCVVLGLNNDFCSFHHFRPQKFEILKFVVLVIFCPPSITANFWGTPDVVKMVQCEKKHYFLIYSSILFKYFNNF